MAAGEAAVACPPLRHVAVHWSHCAPDHSAVAAHLHLHDESNSPPFAHAAVVAHAAGSSTSAYLLRRVAMACNTTLCIAPTCCNIARRMPTADPGSAQPVARNRHRTAHHIVSKSRPQMGHRHASCDSAQRPRNMSHARARGLFLRLGLVGAGLDPAVAREAPCRAPAVGDDPCTDGRGPD